VKDEVNEIIYLNREKQMVRRNASLTSSIRSGFGLLRSDIPAAIGPMMKNVTK
jgi:hypothetical protein